jgi:hypothetical protein
MNQMFSKKKTPKQTGLFGKAVKEAAPEGDDEVMEIEDKKPVEDLPRYVPWVEK